MTSKKGATEFDKKCHSIFDAKNDGHDYLARGVNLPCDNCGHELRAYYCEAQLLTKEQIEALERMEENGQEV